MVPRVEAKTQQFQNDFQFILEILRQHMGGTIEEVNIQDPKVSQDTADFYEKLGLMAIISDSALRLISTRTTQIIGYDKCISLNIGRSMHNRLIGDIQLDRLEDGQYVVFDNIGTKVLISRRYAKSHIRIGVLTSGGDAPGMNSAVKSIIRASLKKDIKVFGIYRGFEGLIRGDIRKLGWNTETQESGQGGTCLLSARSIKFKTEEGMKEAARNLFMRRINSLVIIGGDGSMNGALSLRRVFRRLCWELIQEGAVSEEHVKIKKDQKGMLKSSSTGSLIFKDMDSKERSKGELSSLSTENIEDILINSWESDSSEEFNMAERELYDLNVVGIPGTIDNDVCGTDFTLGSDSAITRVIEVAEKLNTTMRSHRRIFVLECMGRDCGWITLMAGVACDADYVLIPEDPKDNWQEDMLKSIKTAYYNHKPNIFIFLCEHAVDVNGNRIAMEEVEAIIKAEGLSARGLVIGHVQRGGITSAKDRIFGTMAGIRAVDYLINSPGEPVMVSTLHEEYLFSNLEGVIRNNHRIKELYEERRYREVMEMRSAYFRDTYLAFEAHRKMMVERYFKEHLHSREEDKEGRLHANAEKKLTESVDLPDETKNVLCLKEKRRLRIGVLHDGIRSAGMNAALNSIVQFALSRGNEVFYFIDGYDGVEHTQARKADIYEFSRKHSGAGSVIGTSHCRVVNVLKIKERLEDLKIDYLIVMGGTRNLEVARHIKNVILIPCCISNNFPGTQQSIGSDTALNTIIASTAACKLTSLSVRRTIFVIEVSGGNCGYLSIMGGVASGVFEVLYPEECTLDNLMCIKRKIRDVFRRQVKNSVIIFRNQNTFDGVPVESLCKILCCDTDIRYNFSVLGHLERGIVTSALDRINARLSALKALEMCAKDMGSGVVGIQCTQAVYTHMEEVLDNYDAERDTVKHPTWLQYADVCNFLE